MFHTIYHTAEMQGSKVGADWSSKEPSGFALRAEVHQNDIAKEAGGAVTLKQGARVHVLARKTGSEWEEVAPTTVTAKQVSLTSRNDDVGMREKLLTIASQFRAEEERFLDYEDDPNAFLGTCQSQANSLCQRLQALGIPARRVGGYYRHIPEEFFEKHGYAPEDLKWKHWWVVTDAGWIVDTTADQFHPEDPQPYRVVVTRNDPHYPRTKKAASRRKASSANPAFDAWFKGSKVVNEDGTPKIVYHGTKDTMFEVFQTPAYFSENADESVAYSGYHDTRDAEKARKRHRMTKLPAGYKAGQVVEGDPYSSNQFSVVVVADYDGPDGKVFMVGDDALCIFLNDKPYWIEGYHGVYADDFSSFTIVPGDSTEVAQRKADTEEHINERFNGGKSGHTMPVYLSIKNPIELSWSQGNIFTNGRWSGDTETKAKAQIEQYKAQGYDGIKTLSDAAVMAQAMGEGVGEVTNWIPFYPNQIKSAIANNGEFSNDDHRMTAAKTAAVDVASPEFKAWFRNSKIVDDNGAPLAVHHGSEAKIHKFEPQQGERYTMGQSYKVNTQAFFFTPDTVFAKSFGKEITKVYLRMERPLDLRDGAWGQPSEEALQVLQDYFGEQVGFLPPEELWEILDDVKSSNAIKALGYDGVMFRELGKGQLHTTFAVFSPNQIKSATRNSGKFNDDDHRITAAISEEERRLFETPEERRERITEGKQYGPNILCRAGKHQPICKGFLCGCECHKQPVKAAFLRRKKDAGTSL